MFTVDLLKPIEIGKIRISRLLFRESHTRSVNFHILYHYNIDNMGCACSTTHNNVDAMDVAFVPKLLQSQLSHPLLCLYRGAVAHGAYFDYTGKHLMILYERRF